MPDALKQYYASAEFSEYLKAKEAWERAYFSFLQCAPEDKFRARSAYEAAEKIMRERLAVCRSMPIHKDAFGW